LYVVHNMLVGYGLRSKVKIICSGQVLNAFDLIKRFAEGADMCNSARAMMLSLGCIQAYRCNSNTCPTGVATTNPALYRGLDVSIKGKRVANFHRNTLHAVAEMVGAMGLDSTNYLNASHIMRRVSPHSVQSLEQLRPSLCDGDILHARVSDEWKRIDAQAVAGSFRDQTDVDFSRHHSLSVASNAPAKPSFKHASRMRPSREFMP